MTVEIEKKEIIIEEEELKKQDRKKRKNGRKGRKKKRELREKRRRRKRDRYNIEGKRRIRMNWIKREEKERKRLDATLNAERRMEENVGPPQVRSIPFVNNSVSTLRNR